MPFIFQAGDRPDGSEQELGSRRGPGGSPRCFSLHHPFPRPDVQFSPRRASGWLRHLRTDRFRGALRRARSHGEKMVRPAGTLPRVPVEDLGVLQLRQIALPALREYRSRRRLFLRYLRQLRHPGMAHLRLAPRRIDAAGQFDIPGSELQQLVQPADSGLRLERGGLLRRDYRGSDQDDADPHDLFETSVQRHTTRPRLGQVRRHHAVFASEQPPGRRSPRSGKADQYHQLGRRQDDGPGGRFRHGRGHLPQCAPLAHHPGLLFQFFLLQWYPRRRPGQLAGHRYRARAQRRFARRRRGRSGPL